ncbi:MAG: hypothetical protein U1F35_05670 [Steroidobacteraceae bacterium]
MTRFRDAAAMVDKMRSETRSAAPARPQPLVAARPPRVDAMVACRVRKQLSHQRCADALASIGKIEAAIRKGDTSAVENGYQPPAAGHGIVDQKVKDQIRLDFAARQIHGTAIPADLSSCISGTGRGLSADQGRGGTLDHASSD